MRASLLKAFLLGTAAFGVLGYAAAAAVALAAQAGERALDVRLGPLALVVVERAGGRIATTFGAGILAVAVAGGIANALFALVLARRRRE